MGSRFFSPLPQLFYLFPLFPLPSSLFGDFSLFVLSYLRLASSSLLCLQSLLERRGDVSSVKLSDFGMAVVLDDRSLLSSHCDTPHYAAPEVLRGDVADQEAGVGNSDVDGSRVHAPIGACDMWSLGAIVFLT